MGLLVLGVEVPVLTHILLWPSHHRPLSWVVEVTLHYVASPEEVEPDLLETLSLIESYLDSSVALTDSLKIIVLELGRNHVLHVGDSLHLGLVGGGRQAREVQINHVVVLAVQFLVVVPEGVVATDI